MQPALGILGLGNLGTALGHTVAHHYPDKEVWGWAHSESTAWEINTKHTSEYLPGIDLPHNLKATNYLEELFAWNQVVIVSLPAKHLLGTIKQALPFIEPHHIIVNTSKGLDESSGQPVFVELTQLLPVSQLLHLSGPMLAEEIAQHQPSTGLVAGEQNQLLIDLLSDTELKLEAYSDPIGLSWVGILKNIYAIGLGMLDYLTQGSLNVKGWYLTLAWQEMEQFYLAHHLDPQVLKTTAGLGDLICTAMSGQSHNQSFGHCIAEHDHQSLKVVEPEGCHTLRIMFAQPGNEHLRLAEATFAFINQQIDAQTWLEKSLFSS